jgi:hypothetical protein
MIRAPKGVTPDNIQARATASWGTDTSWYDILQDAYDFFLPQREVLNIYSPGQKKMDQIFDSTAVFGTKEFANRMQANLTPIWRSWATFDLSAEVEAQLEEMGQDSNEIRIQLQKTAAIVFDYLNHSNFATQINEAYLDLCIGTTCIMVNESDDPVKIIEFKTLPQVGIGYEVGPSGSVEHIFKKVQYIARNLERQFPGIELTTELKETVKNAPESKVEFTHAMIFDGEERKFWEFLLPKGGNTFLWSQEYDEYGPWVVGRWSVISGEVRGRGPALDVLPDVKSLNKIKEFALRKAAIDLSGIWTAVDDGVTNPYTIRIMPGIVIPVGTNDRTSPSLQRLDTTNDLALTQFQVGEMQLNIRRTLFNDLRDPAGPVRSATEIAIDSRELAQRMGSAFGRLQTEVLEPILNRVISILRKLGKIPDIQVDGRQVTIKFTSPLSRAQDTDDLLAVQQAVQFVQETAGPEAAMVSFNIDKFAEFAADKTGMDQTLVKSEIERQKTQQAILQKEQAVRDQQQQQAPTE